MLQATNFAQVSDGLDKWVEACEELANAAFRGYVTRVFKYILDGTPQWSGALVASWRITVGQLAHGHTENPFKDDDIGTFMSDPNPFSRRSPNAAALAYAKQIAREALMTTRLGAPVFISNTAPYAWNVEQNRDELGRSFLRVVNLPVEMVYAAEGKFGRFEQVNAFALAKEAL